jgi:septal ring factor EnvC (AmiA/AmiB activator)
MTEEQWEQGRILYSELKSIESDIYKQNEEMKKLIKEMSVLQKKIEDNDMKGNKLNESLNLKLRDFEAFPDKAAIAEAK